MRTRARQIGVRRREWLSNCLFHTTYENLGSEAEAWLAWWWDARERYAVQFRPERPVERAFVEIETQAGSRRVELDAARSDWEIGRSLQSEVSVRDVSVSRSHAAILRLGRGFAFRDLGSRQGVRVEGERRTLGTLLPGDVLQVGRVKVAFGTEAEASAGPGQPAWIDRLSYTALVEESAPQIVQTLIAFLDPAALLPGLSAPLEARAPGLGDELVYPFLDSQRRLARETLPRACGVDCGPQPEAWREWWERARASWAPQLAPRGWIL